MRLLCSSETYIYTVFPLDDLKMGNSLFGENARQQTK